MITCPECGHINPDDAVTCENCMVLLNKDLLPKEPEVPEAEMVPDAFSDTEEDFSSKYQGLSEDKFSSSREVDVMFVFDCTGSMMGEIRAMQDAIIDFASTVKNEGLNVRLGLIEFRDRFEGEEHLIHNFSGDVFTSKIREFQKAVDTLEAKGGGPIPESVPDAIMLALKQTFRDCPNKTIVLITDAPPHLPDKSGATYEAVVKGLEAKDINQFYVVTMLRNPACHVHLQLLEGVQKYGGDGLAFELSKKDEDRKNHFIKVLRGLAKSITSKSI